MAIKYVSQDTSNGYTLGDDAANGDSIGAPYLTLTHAITQVASTDTIVLNDGTYTAGGYLAINDDVLTILPENDGMATITSSGSARVIHVNRAGSNVTFGAVIIDAGSETSTDYCITTGSVIDITLTFNGTQFLNPNVSFMALSRLTSVTMDSGWSATADALTGHGFQFLWLNGFATAGSVSISDGTMTVSDMNNSNSRSGINITAPDIAGCTVDINNVTMTLTTVTASDPTVGINVADMESSTIYNNTITLIGSTTASTGISHGVSGFDDTDTCNIYGNTINLPSGAAGGIGILCGADDDNSPAGANSITSPNVYNNTVNNGSHGIEFGWVTGGRAYGNTVTGCYLLGLLHKGATDCIMSGNKVIDCGATSGGALRFKGATGCIFANNTVHFTTGASLPNVVAILADTFGATNSTGCFVYNNSLVTDTTIDLWVKVNTSSDCVFGGNNYYVDSNGAVSANPFLYYDDGASPFASVTAWNAATDVGTETEVDLLLDATYHPKASSPAYHAGTFAGHIRDFNGRPYHIPPTIGAYEFNSGAPAQPRTPRY